MFDAETIIDGIGKPDWERMLMAAAFAATIPEIMGRAAHSTEWAPEVLFYLLLDADEAVREKQLLTVAQKMGADSEAQVAFPARCRQAWRRRNSVCPCWNWLFQP